MEFNKLDVNFSMHKTYKRIAVKSLLAEALLGMNDPEDTSIPLFGQEFSSEKRGKGTTAEGLHKNNNESYVINT
jgi:hypothetical protein